ncbi:MAG: FKBP-type peptidyl-prolyl cis-trans isomerase [Saprospiraceae bacterium]|nr:FKBP-type peptidyl-prolyl cis-trans isomerase [Saprospiraceae bacterium]
MNKIIMIFAIALTIGACSNTPEEVRTESGFKVDFLSDVEGPVAKVGDFVSFQYAVSNGESVVFDSREVGSTPQTTIPPTTNAKLNTSGVIEALKLCSKGDSVTVYYPVDSMATPPSGFEGKPFIIYTIKVEDVQDAAVYEAEQKALEEASREVYLTKKTFLDETMEAYKAGQLDGELVKLPSGLQIMIHEAGTEAKPEAGQTIFANYIGVLKSDGSEFDNSFMRGEPLQFPLGRGGVIAGWDEGFAQLGKGAKATLFIPSNLGYGERGYPPQIPENADLVFYVELVDFQ